MCVLVRQVVETADQRSPCVVSPCLCAEGKIHASSLSVQKARVCKEKGSPGTDYGMKWDTGRMECLPYRQGAQEAPCPCLFFFIVLAQFTNVCLSFKTCSTSQMLAGNAVGRSLSS